MTIFSLFQMEGIRWIEALRYIWANGPMNTVTPAPAIASTGSTGKQQGEFWMWAALKGRALVAWGQKLSGDRHRH